MGGLGSGRTSHISAAGKCEHWRSIDLADLKRMGLLKPVVGGNGNGGKHQQETTA